MTSLRPINTTQTVLNQLGEVMFVVPTSQSFSLTNTTDKAVFSIGGKSAIPMNPVVFGAPMQSVIQCGDVGSMSLHTITLNIGDASGFCTLGLTAKTFFTIYKNGTLWYQWELATNTGNPFYTEVVANDAITSNDLLCFSLHYSSAPPSYPIIYVNMLLNFSYTPL
jgi:hypothetical protein